MLKELSELRKLPMRFWISFADTANENFAVTAKLLQSINYQLVPSRARWAAYEAIPRVHNATYMVPPLTRVPMRPAAAAPSRANMAVSLLASGAIALTIMPSNERGQPGDVELGQLGYAQVVANNGEHDADRRASTISQDSNKKKPGSDEAGSDRPTGGVVIGSAEYERNNERRYELIRKRVRTGLNVVEEAEFQRLQTEILAATKAAYPHPRLDRESWLREKERAREKPNSPD